MTLLHKRGREPCNISEPSEDSRTAPRHTCLLLHERGNEPFDMSEPSEYSRTFSHVPEYSRTFSHVPEYSRTFSHDPEYSRTFSHNPEYSRTFSYVPDYSRTFSIVPEYSRTFSHVPEYSSEGLPQVFHGVLLALLTGPTGHPGGRGPGCGGWAGPRTWPGWGGPPCWPGALIAGWGIWGLGMDTCWVNKTTESNHMQFFLGSVLLSANAFLGVSDPPHPHDFLYIF